MAGCGCGCADKRQKMINAVAHIAKDPVCGRKVNRLSSTTQHITQADGEHFFCSTKCMTEYINNPEKYSKKKNLLERLGLG